jgi:diacylglycerol kinase family enzyme
MRLGYRVQDLSCRNHFAMDLGLDRADPSMCVATLSDGVELGVDLGIVGDRTFVNKASFGAYAAVQGPSYRDDKTAPTSRPVAWTC